MKVYFIYISVLLALFLSFIANGAFAQEKIIISVHDYMPYYNKDGKGLMDEVYKEIFHRVGVEASLKAFPIKRGLAYLFDNTVDAFSPGHIFMSPDMKKNAEWDTSFIVALSMFYYKPNFKKPIVFNTLDDLRGYKLAVLVNTSFIPLYKKHHIEYYEAQNPQRMLKMAKAGHVDFFVITILTGMILINQEYPDVAHDFDYFVFKKLPCSLAVSKGNPNYKKRMAQFQKGLNEIKADGTYIQLLEQYWGKGNIPKDVLFDDLTSFGVDHVDPKVFNKFPRNELGRIVH